MKIQRFYALFLFVKINAVKNFSIFVKLKSTLFFCLFKLFWK